MPNYIKTKVIEGELSKIEEVEKTLIEQSKKCQKIFDELNKEIHILRDAIITEQKDKQKRMVEAFNCLKSE